ncbi:hypothetical protein [Streptomyces lydicus]|uniref:hypothetical protein n=1 Tax=Streptomyces lydicus TaxID=47763 RepID=UPI0037B6FBFF
MIVQQQPTRGMQLVQVDPDLVLTGRMNATAAVQVRADLLMAVPVVGPEALGELGDPHQGGPCWPVVPGGLLASC